MPFSFDENQAKLAFGGCKVELALRGGNLIGIFRAVFVSEETT